MLVEAVEGYLVMVSLSVVLILVDVEDLVEAVLEHKLLLKLVRMEMIILVVEEAEAVVQILEVPVLVAQEAKAR